MNKKHHHKQGRIRHFWRLWQETVQLMFGVPNYDRYVAQQRRHNVKTPVMTYRQFQDYCQKRHLSGKGSRCC
jgi:uncharacterized short protein YbdD (DUF466 family)